MENLKSKLIIKTREGKFVRINSDGINTVHLPSSYGCKASLDLLKSFMNRFTFISDDYFNQHQSDLFFEERERRRFIYFLRELDLHDFFLIKKVDRGKFVKIYFHHIRFIIRIYQR
jgi:hypothetical protein